MRLALPRHGVGAVAACTAVARVQAVRGGAGHVVATLGALRARLTVESPRRATAIGDAGIRACGRRLGAARPLGRAERDDARQTAAAVSIRGARTGKWQARSCRASENAVGIRNARHIVAAVAAVRAGIADILARTDAVTARHPQAVELTLAAIANRAAAVISRARVAARVLFVVANVPFGVAPFGISADANLEALRNLARDIPIAR